MNAKKFLAAILISTTACSATACAESNVDKILNEVLVALEENKTHEKNQGDTTDEYTNDTSDNTDTSKFSGDFEKFYRVTGQAEVNPAAIVGEITYLPLDELGRAQGAYGKITQDMYFDAKGNNPPNKTNPTGFVGNEETDFSYKDKNYHGWFYNRSHLIADSLGGNISEENMITGTRMQNVGWNDRKSGMAYSEEKARQFLEHNANCPLYYSATPNFHDEELVARTVTVNIQSCDKSINEQVIVDNNSPSHTINYTTGEWTTK